MAILSQRSARCIFVPLRFADKLEKASFFDGIGGMQNCITAQDPPQENCHWQISSAKQLVTIYEPPADRTYRTYKSYQHHGIIAIV